MHARFMNPSSPFRPCAGGSGFVDYIALADFSLQTRSHRHKEAAEILAVSGESGGLLLCVFRWHFVGCLVLQVRSSLVAIPSFDYLCSFAQLRMYLLRQCSQRARTPIAPASSRLWPQRPSTLVSGLSSGHGIGRAGRRDDS